MPEMRAIVTGATGFVGSNLVRRLQTDGWHVHAIVRPKSDLRNLLTSGDAIRAHEHDGTTEDLARLFDRVRPDVVFHLASCFLASHAPSDIERLIGSNVLFISQLLEAASITGCHRLINAGTSWQHFNSSDYEPVNLYAATKEAAENILRFYTGSSRLRAITLKLFDTYGSGDLRPKLVKMLLSAAETGDKLNMSPGGQLIDIVHVDDVVEAFVQSAGILLRDEGATFQSYAVSSGQPLSLQALVQMLSSVTGRPICVSWGANPYREREVMTPWTGSTLVGWSPKVTLETGLKNLWDSR